MNTEKRIAISFYQHLGKLFYAIALADKKMKEEEFEVMKKEVSLLSRTKHLIISNTNIDIEHCIIATFDMLYFKNTEAQICYKDFIKFKKANESLFTESLKKIIVEIASKIATSFSNVNKSELMMLAKLSIEFKKTN